MQQRQHKGILRQILAMGISLLMTQPFASGQATPNTGTDAEQCSGRVIPQLIDVTAKTGIHFKHTSDPEKKIIIESMTGGILLLDYDRDGWVDVYFTNAPSVAMANAGKTARGALYHNNHDGTFTDVTEKAGVATPCFAMGGSVGDYNNDGWPDMYITCHGGNVLYRNNGDGTFTDVAKQAGVTDGRWSMGSAFGDYDGDGFVDLMVSNYVDLNFKDPPKFGGGPTCKYRGIDVQCGPRGLKGAGDSLFHNNGDGTFTDVSKQAGVDDPAGYYGLTVVWSDFNNTGRPSIFVANDSTPNFLYRNEGNGKFTEIGLQSGTAVNADGSEQANMGVAIGDYLHTGLPAIYSTSYADEYKVLYRNNGDWDFKDVTHEAGLAVPSLPWVGWGTGFVDLDNDGWIDIMAVNGHVYPQVDSLATGAKYLEPKNVFLNQKRVTYADWLAQRKADSAAKQALAEIVCDAATSDHLAERESLDLTASEADDEIRDLPDPCALPGVEYFKAGCGFCIGDIAIAPFTTPHDAADPCGFVFVAEGIRVAVATDLGYIPSNVQMHLQHCDVLMLESNHDLEMLRDGPYPWSVKQRVLSRVGHLSNDATADFLSRTYDGYATYVILAHLSESNNLPELARVSAERALRHRTNLLGNKLVLARQSLPIDPISL